MIEYKGDTMRRELANFVRRFSMLSFLTRKRVLTCLLVIFVTAAFGFEVMNFNIREILPYPAATVPRGVVCDDYGNSWIALSFWEHPAHVVKWDWNDLTFYPIPTPKIEGLLILPDERIAALCVEGLKVFDVDTFVDFSPALNFDFTRFSCRGGTVDSSGNVWITNWGYQIAKYDGYEWSYYSLPDSSCGPGDRHLFVDDRDNLWVQLYHGLYRINTFDLSWRLYRPLELGIDAYLPRISDIQVDRDSTMWIGTDENGLRIINDSISLEYIWHFDADSGVSSIYEIYRDHTGNTWVTIPNVNDATIKLICFSDPYHYELFDTSDGLMMGGSQAIAEDIYGNIWTGDGHVGFSCINLDRISRTPIERVDESKNIDQTMQISVLPNPSAGFFDIEIPENAEAEIFDIRGRKVGSFSKTFRWQPKSNLSSGGYLVSVKNNEGYQTTKKIIYLK